MYRRSRFLYFICSFLICRKRRTQGSTFWHVSYANVQFLQAVDAISPFLEAGLAAEDAKKVAKAFVQRIENEDDLKTAANDVDEEEGEPLTDKPLKFSLAYGERFSYCGW